MQLPPRLSVIDTLGRTAVRTKNTHLNIFAVEFRLGKTHTAGTLRPTSDFEQVDSEYVYESHSLSETMVRHERLAMAFCKGPTSSIEEDMCDECKDDDLPIQGCEACIWHVCEPRTRLKQLSLRVV